MQGESTQGTGPASEDSVPEEGSAVLVAEPIRSILDDHPGDERVAEALSDLAELIKITATGICDEHPDVPEPHHMLDMDSFSIVHVLLELDNSLDMELLENMEEHRGETFENLASFIMILADEKGELSELIDRIDDIEYHDDTETGVTSAIHPTQT